VLSRDNRLFTCGIPLFAHPSFSSFPSSSSLSYSLGWFFQGAKVMRSPARVYDLHFQAAEVFSAPGILPLLPLLSLKLFSLRNPTHMSSELPSATPELRAPPPLENEAVRLSLTLFSPQDSLFDLPVDDDPQRASPNFAERRSLPFSSRACSR